MKRRECSKCHRKLPVTSFGYHKNGRDQLRSRCIPCNREDARETYRRNPAPYKRRARVFSKRESARRVRECEKIKAESGCALCPESEPCVLDFHHVKGNSKGRDGGMPVTRAAHFSERRFRLELAKCVVLCANCHRKVHAGVLKLPKNNRPTRRDR